jgi:peptidoglycan/xylan/chitin deacetylase (PgdA/CDA1 family)
MAFKLALILAATIASVYSCTPAEQALCKLPDCLCPSLNIPGGLTRDETPQIVYLTFDDAVSVINYGFYEELIFPLKNPNGAPISSTYYITHEYNNYSMIHELHNKGHEIALHSISHTSMTDYWKKLNGTGWELEVRDQRGQVAHFAKIEKKAIKGFRAPFLQTGGDAMMQVLYDEGLEYDCSRPTRNFLDPALWPYTADYDQKFQDCQIEPCSNGSYPGFWIVPMVDYIGDNGEPCAMVDTCQPVPETRETTLDLLKRNFLRHYNGNKAPFGVFTHAAWFQNGDDVPPKERKEGYKQFLDYLGTLDDVYIVSVAKAIEWIKTPTKLADLATFEPWLHEQDLPSTCTQKYNCHFPADSTPFPSERYMYSCQACPRKYPWLGNPYGLNP